MVQDLPAWVVKVTPDQMTDKSSAAAYIETSDGRLSFLCDQGDNRPVIVVQPSRFLGGSLASSQFRDVQYRFDESPPVATRWKYHGRFATPGAGKDTERFVLALLGASGRVRLRLVAFDRGQVDLDFPLSGAKDAVRQAVAACTKP
jgi:hypothetical protein